MKNDRVIVLPIVAVSALCIALSSFALQEPSLQEIVDKNIQAIGGKEKIDQIRNYSFKDEQTTYYVSLAGRMKLTSGKDPVITEVVLINEAGAKRNCFNKITEYGSFEETTYQYLAKLYGGLFTLSPFAEDLEFQGTRRFGPKMLHMLSTKANDLAMEFYVDSGNYLIERIVFRGHSPESGKYEVNHDIGPYQEIEGLKIPSSWFSSRVGTRGTAHQVTDVKWNLELDKDFFTDAQVKVGKTDFSGGILRGNIVDFSIMRGNRIMISTNWTDDCIQRAGFKSEDKLILMIDESRLELDFYASQPPRTAYGQDTILMLPSRSEENFVIYILASGYQELADQLEPLMPIQIKKKE